MDYSKQRHKELGDFLKTRRAKILPSQVGLPDGTRRRTPGLRREEVAALSGIGVTWYTWLEQGRPIQVSAQVLESLSRVLMMDKQEAVHLFTLAQQASPIFLPSYIETVSPMLQHVLDSLRLSPAMIMDIQCNIIAWNDAASAVFLDFGKLNVCERNLVRIMFTNQEYKQLFKNWESHAKGMLARFRSACGKFIETPWILEFVDALKNESKEFNLWWSLHDVEAEKELYKTVNHPILGELTFEHTSYLISEDTNLKMYINTPLAGTDTEKKVKQLLINKKR